MKKLMYFLLIIYYCCSQTCLAMNNPPVNLDFSVAQNEDYILLKARYYRHKLQQNWDQIHGIHIPGGIELKNIIRNLPNNWSLKDKEEFLINLIRKAIKAHLLKLKEEYNQMIIIRECKK